ncbi:MAG: AMP-binding protein [Planctomycetes bacterium]|nr:AMP-binding protein [Planctomycetota bacterium]
MSERSNTAELLRERARSAPTRTALIEPDGARAWRKLSFAELEREVDLDAHAFVRAGLQRGDRVCVFVKPGSEWAAIVFALFRIGALPVLIDPAMGRAGLLACVERIRPRGFIGIPLASAIKLAFPRSFASVEVALVAGPLPLGGRTLRGLRRAEDGAFPSAATLDSDRAAVLFTSGSTGPAKGVSYTHGMFRAQVAALRELNGMREGDVDLACFAPFALFGPALGLTTVLPRIDFSHPAQADPAEIVRAIREHGAVQTFGSPAIWRRVAPWAAERGITLPSLRRLMIAGAPVHPPLIESCLALLAPEADVYTPYGATEALPVACIGGREILARHRAATESGAGNCIGTLAPFIEARVIRVTDDVLPAWSESLVVARGEAGELVVRGPQVTREYELEPEHTARAKIPDGTSVWHRMGDVVREDGAGRLWFLGRKSHRLATAHGTLFPVGIENAFNVHLAVRRSALVGVGARGAERAVLVVELAPGKRPSAALATEILARRQQVSDCRVVEELLFHEQFPVDLRHNAKIDRAALKAWAEERLA